MNTTSPKLLREWTDEDKVKAIKEILQREKDLKRIVAIQYERSNDLKITPQQFFNFKLTNNPIRP